MVAVAVEDLHTIMVVRLAGSRGSYGRRRPRWLVVGVSVLLAFAGAACAPSSPPPPTPTTGPTDATVTPTPDRPTTPASTPTPAPTPPTPPPPPAPAPPPPPPAPPPPGVVPSAWLGIDVERLPTSEPVVALTFDGGSSDTAVASILAVLDRYDAPATFFVTGDFARTYPRSLGAIAAAGHAVGNHSDTHRHYPGLRDVEIRADLAAAEASITAVTGRPARPLFRFPYGDRTAADIAVVNAAGYVPVRWTVDTLGWKGTGGGMDADAVVERVLGTAVPGQIVLMHVGANPDDGTTLDADALPGIIDGLRGRGYTFVDLAGFPY